MGWASGSILMNQIVKAVKPEVADNEARKRIYKPIIEAFESDDWDTQDESMGIDEAFDDVMADLHPDWFEYEEDDDNED